MKLLFFACILSSVASFSLVQQQTSRVTTTTQLAATDSRRNFLGNASIFAGCSLLGWPVVPPPAMADSVDYKAVAEDIKKLVADDPDKVRRIRIKLNFGARRCSSALTDGT